MDPATALAICQERLGRWATDLAGETATPVLLMGVKHGQGRGELVLCMTEDMETHVVRGFLMAALRALPANGGRP